MSRGREQRAEEKSLVAPVAPPKTQTGKNLKFKNIGTSDHHKPLIFVVLQNKKQRLLNRFYFENVLSVSNDFPIG